MNDTLETPQPPAPPAGNPRRRFFRRAVIATVGPPCSMEIGHSRTDFLSKPRSQSRHPAAQGLPSLPQLFPL